MNEPVSQHLVSKGYQRNFASSDSRVSLIDVNTGRALGRPRAIKHNFTEKDFNTRRPTGGSLDYALEVEYSKIETVTLNDVRRLGPETHDSKLLASAIALSAMHLVRSHAYRGFQDELIQQLGEDHARDIETDRSIRERFVREHGRVPQAGELADLSRSVLSNRVDANDLFVDGSVHAFNRISEILRNLYPQVIEIDSQVSSGFVFGDIPVVHVKLSERRFGFRDRLAVGDADLIMTPLTRRTAVFFSSRPRSSRHLRRVTTHEVLRTINTLTIDAALDAVACHPDDQKELAKTWRYRASYRTHQSVWH